MRFRTFLLPIVAIGLNACVSVKSYVDPKFDDVEPSSVQAVNTFQDVAISYEFTRKDKRIKRAEKELQSAVELALDKVGIVTVENSATTLTVSCVNIADTGDAAAKGFGTGLTLGLAGSAISDFYEVTFTLSNETATVTRTYEHAIHSTIGNKKAPLEGVPAAESIRAAFNEVIEEALFQFLIDAQTAEVVASAFVLPDYAAIGR